MRFEVQNALRELDRTTPAYYRGEIFSHGSLKLRTEAVKILSQLGEQPEASRALREMLKITP